MTTYDDLKKILNPDEMNALWTYHHEAELKAADRGEYADAQSHKERKRLYYREPLTPP